MAEFVCETIFGKPAVAPAASTHCADRWHPSSAARQSRSDCVIDFHPCQSAPPPRRTSVLLARRAADSRRRCAWASCYSLRDAPPSSRSTSIRCSATAGAGLAAAASRPPPPCFAAFGCLAARPRSACAPCAASRPRPAWPPLLSGARRPPRRRRPARRRAPRCARGATSSAERQPSLNSVPRQLVGRALDLGHRAARVLLELFDLRLRRGCRCASRSAATRGARSGPSCRSPATACRRGRSAPCVWRLGVDDHARHFGRRDRVAHEARRIFASTARCRSSRRAAPARPPGRASPSCRRTRRPDRRRDRATTRRSWRARPARGPTTRCARSSRRSRGPPARTASRAGPCACATGRSAGRARSSRCRRT